MCKRYIRRPFKYNQEETMKTKKFKGRCLIKTAFRYCQQDLLYFNSNYTYSEMRGKEMFHNYNELK